MKILGIDTATKFLSIGLYDGSHIYEYNLGVGIRLSSIISITIKRVLEALNWRIDDIDYFACGLGPGSFTGIRVGLTTIKGFGFALKKPIIGISTLDILARNTRLACGFVMPIIDAKRNLIYCSIYKAKNGMLNRISPYMLLKEDEFLKKIRNNSILLGDGVSLYKDKIFGKKITTLDRDYWYPKAHNIIEVACERIREKKINDAFNIKPIYLYTKECQIRTKK